MAARTVRRGYVVYTNADGRPVTGYLGEEVDVHEDHLERFDRLNGPEVDEIVSDSSDGEPVELVGEEADVPDASDSTWTHERIDRYAGDNGISFDGIEAKNPERPTREEKVAHILKIIPEIPAAQS